MGEVGVSYLQEGSQSPKPSTAPQPADYTRKQLGTDLRIAPMARLELTGHSLFNVGTYYQVPGSPQDNPSRVAEHDYLVSYRFTPAVKLAASYTERNLDAYFAGSNLPNLFKQNEQDKHKGMGAVLTLAANDKQPEMSVDFRHTQRQTTGNANRYGVDLRWATAEAKLKGGVGAHRVDADKAAFGVPASAALYGMSRDEARAWAMYETGKYTCSLDGILYHFNDSSNPNLFGKSNLGQVVASLGMRPTENLSVSGDLSIGMDAYYQNQTSVLLRTTYRFAVASKGGSK
jgi:hypothetical protein